MPGRRKLRGRATLLPNRSRISFRLFPEMGGEAKVLVQNIFY